MVTIFARIQKLVGGGGRSDTLYIYIDLRSFGQAVDGAAENIYTKSVRAKSTPPN